MGIVCPGISDGHCMVFRMAFTAEAVIALKAIAMAMPMSEYYIVKWEFQC